MRAPIFNTFCGEVLVLLVVVALAQPLTKKEVISSTASKVMSNLDPLNPFFAMIFSLLIPFFPFYIFLDILDIRLFSSCFTSRRLGTFGPTTPQTASETDGTGF
jgi:hypothetical protein